MAKIIGERRNIPHDLRDEKRRVKKPTLVREQAGVLYIDGHVRVYNGQQTQLPKHHVARQKLCLRATTDYWVNAMDGQPFMVINKAVDPGLIKVIENDIVPELEERVPKQPEPRPLVAEE